MEFLELLVLVVLRIDFAIVARNRIAHVSWNLITFFRPDEFIFIIILPDNVINSDHLLGCFGTSLVKLDISRLLLSWR